MSNDSNVVEAHGEGSHDAFLCFDDKWDWSDELSFLTGKVRRYRRVRRRGECFWGDRSSQREAGEEGRKKGQIASRNSNEGRAKMVLSAPSSSLYRLFAPVLATRLFPVTLPTLSPALVPPSAPPSNFLLPLPPRTMSPAPSPRFAPFAPNPASRPENVGIRTLSAIFHSFDPSS